MYRQLEDFYAAYKILVEGTCRYLDVLTDDSLAAAAADGHRTLGGMAWHLTTTVTEMMTRTGLALSALDPETMPPASAAEIADAYRRASAEVVEAIRANWTDATLAEVDEMYGEPWPRGLTLSILIHHEIHHRGQMSVLMRRAGLKVPGLYGPAKEEWARHGCEEPPY